MANRAVIFSDIQGNRIALETMFDYLKHLPDFESLRLICLGDIACGYAPNVVLNLLRTHKVQCVKGNMDDVILAPKPYIGDDEDELQYNAMDIWASEELTAINRDFLAEADNYHRFSLFGCDYLCVHGSLFDNNTVLNFDTAQDELEKNFLGASVIFTGHSHRQFMIPVGDKMLINPGSIGFPDRLANGKRPLRAQFMMLAEGRFEFVTLDYPREDFTVAVLNSGMPHAEWYLSQWDI